MTVQMNTTVPTAVREQITQLANRMGWGLSQTIGALACLGSASTDSDLLDAVRQANKLSEAEAATG